MRNSGATLVGMRTALIALVALPLLAYCPTSIECDFHFGRMALLRRTEWRNGKQFGVYTHYYTDRDTGRERECRIITRCD